ncbi:MAG: 1-acyl-sn-glycerol-3-phosphate acyltransferase [Desulfarculaceae bacterium]|jgi:glycerol-3-phosphate dehydrogenase
MERVNFMEIVRRLAHSSRGKPWLDGFDHLAPAWPNPDELNQTAVELTLSQLQDDQVPATREEIERLVEGITCKYDHERYLWGMAAVTALMETLFEQHDASRPFTSPDGRELLHLDLLKQYRQQGLGVAYLVNHSSHLDEFLLVCQLANLDVGLPLFAAGANMMAIESLSKVLKLGSYVVQRRGASKKNLAALFNYCQAISETGGQQAIFLEAWHGGARSRDGSLRYPRRLVTLRGALAGKKDLVIQPVAISYAIVPEDLSLAARQGSLCWVRGLSLGKLAGNAIIHPRSFLWRSLSGLYGRAYVTMPRPWLLSELKQAHTKDREDLHLDEFVSLSAIREIARCKKVMASHLAARGLARARRNQKDAPGDLTAAAGLELDIIKEYHRSAFGQEPDLEDFIVNQPLSEAVADGLATLKKRKIVTRLARASQKIPFTVNEAGLSFYATHGDRRIYSPTADQNIVVVGGGDWGFALTYLIGNRLLEEKRYLNASLTLFDSRPEVVEEMGLTRRPPGRFNDFHLPKNAFVTNDPISAFRKASEVVLVCPLQDLARQARLILENSEQGLKLVVATCGFEPEQHRLPCQLIYDLAEKTQRQDVEVYALVGPVAESDVMEAREAVGILAGPAPHLKMLADLFSLHPAQMKTSSDPLGVQAATILARIYAVWVNYLVRTREIKNSTQIGQFAAQAAEEASRLALALGGKADTFSAASPAWTAVFTADSLAGPCRDLGRQLGNPMRRRADLAATAKKLNQQFLEQGRKLTTYHDLYSAHQVALGHRLEMPIIEQAFNALWGNE